MQTTGPASDSKDGVPAVQTPNYMATATTMELPGLLGGQAPLTVPPEQRAGHGSGEAASSM